MLEKDMVEKVESGTFRVFCTLFDSFYLSRGLLMIESLIAHCSKKPKIYVFCFDDLTHSVLTQLKLEGVIPVSLLEFETPSLLAIKSGRSKGEYCWTCTPHVLKHVIEQMGEQECTYVDADLYFYDNPEVAIPRLDQGSVLITEHRYTPEYDQSSTSGRFCVQFVTFINEPRAKQLLDQWGDQCLEWCFARHEPGRFGDQFYLDAWPAAGQWVLISDDRRVGVAPWNIQQYTSDDPIPYFYHFHDLKWNEDGRFDLGGYRLEPWVRNRLYFPYVRAWIEKSEQLFASFGVPLPRVRTPKSGWAQGLKYWLKSWIKRDKLIHISRFI